MGCGWEAEKSVEKLFAVASVALFNIAALYLLGNLSPVKGRKKLVGYCSHFLVVSHQPPENPEHPLEPRW